MKQIQIIIASARTDLRGKMQFIFDQTPDLEIVAEAHDGDKLMSKLREVSYDLVLIDSSIPGKNAITALKEIKLNWKAIPVVILANSPDKMQTVEIFENGASACIPGRKSPEQLVRILRYVAAGNKFYFRHQLELFKEATA